MKINKDAILIKMAEKVMSRQDLADATGINYKTLHNAISNGYASPMTIGKIARGLGCGVEEIVIIETATA